MGNHAVKIWLLGFIAAGLAIYSCVPPEDPEPQSIDYTFDDPACRHIIDLQNRQRADSLYPYLKHENPTYRWLAARAFASFRSKQAVDSLIPLLRDPFTEVRRQSAFALGQIGAPSAAKPLVRAFQQNDSLGQFTESNAAILEAVGKCGGKKYLTHLSSIRSYLPSDTLLLLGQARGLYRYLLRDMQDSTGTDQMVEWLTRPAYPSAVRRMAAFYLERGDDIELDQHFTALRQTYLEEQDEEIRAIFPLLLGKTGNPSVLKLFENQWAESSSVSERINILSACNFSPYKSAKSFVKKALNDSNRSVGRMAASFFLTSGKEDDAAEYREWAMNESLHISVRLKLYRAALRHLPFYYSLTKAAVRGRLRSIFNASSDPYVKAGVLLALSEEWDYRNEIFQWISLRESPPLRTGALDAYVNAFEQADDLSKSQKSIWLDEMQSVLLKEDVGLSYIAAKTLLKHRASLPVDQLEVNRIKARRDNCPLPEAIEAYNALGRLIAQLNGKSYEEKTPPHAPPIDWSSIRSAPDSIEAEVATDRGSIALRLYPDIAPATTANFISLARDEFYEGKAVHRVVPWFVFQDGCPRGDGFGSRDYTIRSETPPVYYDRPGRLGMASAGPHTESSQWFITHRPTPHLDGQYTIFGQVMDGMDIVNQIGVGDTIRAVQILNSNKNTKENN